MIYLRHFPSGDKSFLFFKNNIPLRDENKTAGVQDFEGSVASSHVPRPEGRGLPSGKSLRDQEAWKCAK